MLKQIQISVILPHYRSVSPMKEVKPVQRSSSLKTHRTKSRDRNSERRKTCLPIISPSPSKDDLKQFLFERQVYLKKCKNNQEVVYVVFWVFTDLVVDFPYHFCKTFI